MTGRDSDKGHRYVTALDNARCQNKWEEVPELIRKVTKHAPQRTCLLEVASAEYQLASHLQKHPSTPRPSSAAGLHDLIPSLLSTVNRAEGSKQEVFQAQVCLGWVHWTVNELGLAAARFPQDFEEAVSELEQAGEELSPWTKTCLVKACYLKGSAQRMTSDPEGALETLHSLTPWVNIQLQSSTNSPQFLYWSEKLLGQGASLACEEASKDLAAANAQTIATTLGFFRLWASHPSVKQMTLPQGMLMDSTTEPVSKSPTWKSYYNLLSRILQQGLPYCPPANGPERPQLASEIRRVESLCEASILRETKFPTADSSNPEVEAWVEQVIQNWEVLCGAGWTDEELGEGGQNAVGRNVLDILYRAATKTYHSHLILRRLFHVHCALADYDLALRALDSYIEIVTSAKERAAKGAESGDLENDGILLRTVSEGVTMLSCFGSEKEAEKAKDLTSLLKEFAEKHVQDDEEQGITLIAPETASTRSQAVAPSDIAAAYRGIGIGLANWAYWTPVNEDRDDIRAEAIDYLERSLAPELEDDANCSSLYTLAVLLAENRDLDGAIDYVKSALTSDAQHKTGQADFARERDLVPLWHLLALLLSAKQDFDIAERSCEAAFEQFPATVTSLAHSDRRPQKQNQTAQDQIAGITHELIDKLRVREKERIIETRMTQLAFVELVEGPGAAVNHSDQLLSLFATLFRSLNLEGSEKANTKTENEHLVPPKSSAGTVKSLRGSFFGRHKGPRAPDRRAEFGQEPKTDNSAYTDSAPAIQVTDGEKSGLNEGTDSRQARKRSNTLRKGDDAHNANSSHVNGDSGTQAGPEAGNPVPDMVGLAVSDAAAQPQSAKQPLGPMAHNMKYNQPPAPAGHSKQPPEQDIRLPTSYAFDSPTRAVTKVPPTQAQKHGLCILIKVWLLIAGLYRRASSFEDAHEACEEAAKQVTRFEALVASQETSARAFRERGWGVPKSTDELWADVYAERGLQSIDQTRPHEAMEHFETALLHYADHPKATVGLSNLLLDVWEEKMPLQPPKPRLDAGVSTLSLSSSDQSKPSSEDNAKRSSQEEKPQAKIVPDSDEEPRLLNRIAARERAFGLLSGLTKRGSAWDNSEAWYALSRAYEAENQIQKLRDVLWWCIELEDRRPIRHWSNIGSGIYVL
ncbi:hypothetical protein AnigIFM62618_001539 [Aspergillus niger]|nr:hypothetical protein AnigIFM62618_001539 [Aspergillus niger]